MANGDQHSGGVFKDKNIKFFSSLRDQDCQVKNCPKKWDINITGQNLAQKLAREKFARVFFHICGGVGV